jgi:fibronectin-binding autotransporter adhesin
MATLYWGPSGGSSTGTWDSSTTTNWFTDLARVTPASAAPTNADDVIFDASSDNSAPFTVTLGTGAVCRDVTASGLDQTMTLAGSAAFTVSGSLSFPSSNFTRTYTGNITFNATATGKNITVSYAGNVLTTGNVTFDGVGGGWTLQSAFAIGTTTGILTVTNGSLNTNGQSVTVVTFDANNSNTRTVTLGASTVTISGATAWTFTTTTGLTFNSNTSTITCSNASPVFSGGGLTYYNVTFSSTAGVSLTVNGANTYSNNLTFTQRGSAGLEICTFNADQTITGALALGNGASTNASCRMMFRSDTIGVRRTLYANGTLGTLQDLDFRDIGAAGTVARPWTGTRIGDCLNNDNITGAVARTVYLVGSGSVNFLTANIWSLTSGTAGATNNFPLAQDTLIIDESSASTLTANIAANLGTFNASARTITGFTFTCSTNSPTIYQDFILSSRVTNSGGSQIIFAGQGRTQVINTNTSTMTQGLRFETVNGTVRLDSNVVTGVVQTALQNGTFDLNEFALSCSTFLSANTNARTIDFGAAGQINLDRGNLAALWNTGIADNLTILGTSNVNLTYSGSTGSRSIYHGSTSGGTEANSISFNVTAGTDSFSIFSGSQVRNLNLTGFSGTFAVSTRTIYGNLTVSSGATVSGGTNVTTFAATSGVQTITSAGKTLDFPITVNAPGATVRSTDTFAQGATRTLTLTAGTFDINNQTTTIGLFATSGSVARVIDFGTNEALTVSGAGASAWSASGSNFTCTGTGTIKMSAATAKTFTGGGFTYPALDQAGAGALTIAGSNTFYDITSTYTATGAATITFTAGTTQTVTQFTVSGTASNQLTLNSTSAGAAWYLSDSSGTNSISYTTLSDSHATGGATWNAYTTNGNVNGGSNNNWNFAIPVTYSYSADIKLRSMAQRGRF